MKHQKEITDLLKIKGRIQAKEIEELGISRNYLFKLHEAGVIEKSASGLYTLPDQIINEHQNLVEVCAKIPKAVISLISALSFHQITTQIPSDIWISVPRGTWIPEFEYLTLQCRTQTLEPYSFGIQDHKVGESIIRVYSPAKTIADCFKFRNIVGLDVAIEALKDVYRSKKASMDELTKAAQVNRVVKVMIPYMESIV